MKRLLFLGIAASALLLGFSAYGYDAQEIVRKGDDVINAPKDAVILSTMTLTDKKGYKSERKLEMYQREGDYRLVRFLSPADQKGIAFLSLPDDVMYLYLPAFHKIRQIASHMKNQSFAGTDFNYDDMSEFKLAKNHKAEILEEEPEMYVLKLTPNEGANKDYSYIRAWYRKDNFYPMRMEYYDKGGSLWRVLERRRLEKIQGYWFPMEMDMKDLKTDHSTLSSVNRVEFDKGLGDDVFSKRNLLRVQ
jgi:outer membrane lipoprotein-sorting protein